MDLQTFYLDIIPSLPRTQPFIVKDVGYEYIQHGNKAWTSVGCSPMTSAIMESIRHQSKMFTKSGQIIHLKCPAEVARCVGSTLTASQCASHEH